VCSGLYLEPVLSRLVQENEKSNDLARRKQILEEKLEELQHRFNTVSREALNLQVFCVEHRIVKA
jgi:hypothetical protein